MGFGGIGIWQLLIILAIVVLLFGTKRLGSIGSDLGKAIKGFKKSVSEQDDDGAKRNVEDKTDPNSAQTQQEKSAAEDKNRS